MAHQSPMISIPKKSTEEVDWTTPIRNLIAQSYGENPDNYAAECAALQRCRQDAVRGAGSDTTARDLLYKYFGQLELLELRFSEIRVNFPWHDAFTNKLVTQTSIAYEKASILFQIASTHSAIAASQSRSDPEGLKRAYYYFRTCAGMLHYINENFLHAPSTDLSREVIKFLSCLFLAQATEVFFEKCTDEKKGNALVAKIGAQAAAVYTSLTEEVKEFMGKGIFDRNWVNVIQIKAKYFSSLSQYYRGLADNAAGKHGDALVRFNLAETHAKEASRTATTFGSLFVSNMSPNLPADAGLSIQERTKAHLVLCTERKNEAQRENDLIYNAILPPAEALPIIEKTVVATSVPIHEVYGSPDVQKTIGQDFFIRLIPLSVHESASVYSEEKAKLVRGEVEKAEGAEGEARSALDMMGVKGGLVRFKVMVEGTLGDEVPMEVRRWKEDIALMEDREGVDGIMQELNRLKENVQRELDSISKDLEIESRDCESQRLKYEHLWTQTPSAGLSKSLRQDLKSHSDALDAAATSDRQVTSMWDAVKGDIQLLLSPQVEDVFRERAGSSGEHLLDLDVGSETDDARERVKIGQYVEQIEERLTSLNKISKERNEVLKDLKDKIQSDDVSHLLLLNRRNSAVEPALFAAELEKFRPNQQRLATTIHRQEVILQEVALLWKGLKELAGRGAGARRWDEREKKKKDTVRRFSHARDVYMEVRDGLAKGLQFYTELTDLTGKLYSNVRTFVAGRVVEREDLSAKIDKEKRFTAAPPPLPTAKPPLPPPAPSVPPSLKSFESLLASMNIHGRSGPLEPQQWQSTPSPQPHSNGVPTQHTLPSGMQKSQQAYGSNFTPQFNIPHVTQLQSQQVQPHVSTNGSNIQGQLTNSHQPSRSSYLPPPPPPQQSSFSPPLTSSFSGLGMFGPSHSAQHTPSAPPALPVSSFPQPSSFTSQQLPYSTQLQSFRPLTQSISQYNPYQTQQRLNVHAAPTAPSPNQFYPSPPPPPPNNVSYPSSTYHNHGYTSPPPPPQ